LIFQTDTTKQQQRGNEMDQTTLAALMAVWLLAIADTMLVSTGNVMANRICTTLGAAIGFGALTLAFVAIGGISHA